jgi:glycosyltransferase involved in cell wall biosynthesis
MPAYNAHGTVRESVESVLSQTVDALELIVVDDGSEEPVAAALSDIRDPRLRVLRLPQGGVSSARNAAMAAARAPLVSQLDADDLWEPDYLEAMLPCFEDPAVGLAYANVTILGHPAGHTDYIGDPSVHPMDRFPKLAEQNPVPSPTATMRTEAVRRVGGYARWLSRSEDYHLYCKLAAAGWRFAYVHRQLARYRWPSPERGSSYGARAQELADLKMWAGFVLRHPSVPGPRRQVRLRVARELERMPMGESLARALRPRRRS